MIGTMMGGREPAGEAIEIGHGRSEKSKIFRLENFPFQNGIRNLGFSLGFDWVSDPALNPEIFSHSIFRGFRKRRNKNFPNWGLRKWKNKISPTSSRNSKELACVNDAHNIIVQKTDLKKVVQSAANRF